jgi:hypothetical protein
MVYGWGVGDGGCLAWTNTDQEERHAHDLLDFWSSYSDCRI